MLDKLVFFLYVVRYGSFSEAAREYGISPSAGSRWILELEAKMGVTLLKRSTRQVVATEAGRHLYERFNSVNMDIEQICAEVQSFGTQHVGRITIAASPLFAHRYLNHIVAEYLQMNPQVRIKLLVTPFEVPEEDADFAIRANATIEGHDEDESQQIERRLMSMPLQVACSPEYLLAHPEPMTPSDLRQHRCLFATTLVGGNRWVFKHKGMISTVTIPDALECDDSELLRSVALKGGGIAYLPEFLLQDDLRAGRLVPLMTEYQPSSFDFTLYYRQRKYMPTHCVDFKQYLISRVEELHLEADALAQQA